MALKDLLWACPLCARTGSLRKAGRSAERCSACHATFRRGDGATIIGRPADGDPIVRTVHDWIALLPPFPELPSHPQPEAVRIRRVTDTWPVRREGELFGWAERFGKRTHGTLRLSPADLHIDIEDGTVLRWGLERLAAIQPSSTSLQLRARGESPVAISFLNASVLLWERWLQEAVRRRWSHLGRGEVHEFQPRIL